MMVTNQMVKISQIYGNTNHPINLEEQYNIDTMHALNLLRHNQYLL